MRWTDVRDEIISWGKTALGAFVAYCALTTIAFANYGIPSESMAPTIEVGDRVVVNKFAYGYSRHSLPMNLGFLAPAGDRRLFERMPERGDVIVFVHPMDGKTMIKRLIGLPGDVIELRAGRLLINGVEAPTTEAIALTRRAHPDFLETAYSSLETLPGGVTHYVHHFAHTNAYSDYGPFRVPERHLFMMGDNRDNSLDSRWEGMGAVPMDNLIGRAELTYFAPRDCQADTACRARWLRPLHE